MLYVSLSPAGATTDLFLSSFNVAVPKLSYEVASPKHIPEIGAAKIICRKEGWFTSVHDQEACAADRSCLNSYRTFDYGEQQ